MTTPRDGDPEATVRAHERRLPSGKVIQVGQHKRKVDRAQPDPAADPKPTAARPKLVRPISAACAGHAHSRCAADACDCTCHTLATAYEGTPPRAARPPLKPKPEAKPKTRPAARPEPVAKPKRKRRGPLVSRAHAAKLAKRALREAGRRHRRGKAIAYGALAIGEIGAVAGLQGVGLALASVAAVAGVIATLAFKGSSYQ